MGDAPGPPVGGSPQTMSFKSSIPRDDRTLVLRVDLLIEIVADLRSSETGRELTDGSGTISVDSMEEVAERLRSPAIVGWPNAGCGWIPDFASIFWAVICAMHAAGTSWVQNRPSVKVFILNHQLLCFQLELLLLPWLYCVPFVGFPGFPPYWGAAEGPGLL